MAQAPTRPSLRKRLVRRPVVAAVSSLLALSLTAHAGSASLIGALDKSFGAGSSDGTPDGMVSLSLGAGDELVRGAVIQPDGKILVVGTTTSSGAGTTSANILLQRFNADGSADKTFGADGNNDGTPDGAVALSLGDGNEEGRAIKLQADGKIVVAGTATAADKSKNIVVARFDRSGALDKSFGADGNSDGTPDGVVGVSLSKGDDVANALAIQADGKILVAGTAASGADSNIAVARLNRNGSLDTGFGAGTADGSPDGVVTLSLGQGREEAVAIALQADGRVLVAGNSTSASGNGSSNIVVARLNRDGKLDAGFGKANDGTPDGIVNVSLGDGDDVASALALQADGKILVAGTTTAADKSQNAAIARLNRDGSADTAFGAGTDDGTPDGSVALSLGQGNDSLSAIAVAADGKIIAAGTTTSTGDSSNVFVARLNRNGSLDKAFGQADDGTPDGVVNLSFGDRNDFGRALALQADGKIIVAGDSESATGSNIVLARLLVKN